MITYLRNGSANILASVVLVVLATSYQVSAQATFNAVCPQNKIGKNDYLQVQFKLENASNVESISPPSFNNFSVISGPNQESGMTSINGKVDQYVSISYVLKPPGPGHYTIGPATASADGKTFKSQALQIDVTNAATTSPPGSSSSNPLAQLGGTSTSPFGNLNFDFPQEPATHQFDDYILKKGENVNEKVKRNLFVKLDVSKTSCYVGEPIVAAIKLYTRLRSETTVTDAPSFNGFSVSEIDLSKSNAAGSEKYNGRDYNVYVLRKVQLYPLQAGTITLDSVVADNKVTFLRSDFAGAQKGDSFFDMMQNFADATSPAGSVVEANVTLKSKPVVITVKPLPDEHKPADFKGAVGNFTIQSSLQKEAITTDDAGNLKVVISGAGNIQLVNAPKISWSAGIDAYDAKISDGLDLSSVPIRGSKTFIYPFTISKPGTYTIPVIAFSFFDPVTAAYKTIATQPLTITVTKGKGSPNSPYIKEAGQPKPGGLRDILEIYGGYVLAGGILLAGILLWIFRRKPDAKKTVAAVVPATTASNAALRGEEAQNLPPKSAIPDNPLEMAYRKLTEEKSPAFYRELDRSLKKYLSAKFNVPSEELHKKRISEELDKSNVGLGTSLRLTKLMDDIELNLYAPPSDINHMTDTYEKASEVVSLLDKQVS